MPLIRKRTESPSTSIGIRWMIRRDTPEVMAIEAMLDAPWDEETILHLLRQRNVIGMVVEHDEVIVGYMIYALHKRRIHLERFAVHPAYRRVGVFRAICNKLRGKLDPARRVSATAVVNERDLDTLLAMKALGWTAFEVVHGHFDDGDSDGIHMVMGIQTAHA